MGAQLQSGSITYKLDELRLWFDGRESAMLVYGSADVSFDMAYPNDLNVYRIAILMEEGRDHELDKTEPMFGLIRDAICDHYADHVWEVIRDEYPEYFMGDPNAEHRLSGTQLGVGRAA